MIQATRGAVAGIVLGMLLGGAPEAGALESTVGAAAQSMKRLSQSARVRFNRTEGLFAGYRVSVRPIPVPWGKVFAEAGMGAHNRGFRWETGIELEGDRYNGAVSAFDRTATNDSDIITEGENTFYSLFFKRDFRDYFRTRNGIEGRATATLRRYLKATGSLSFFAYRSMDVDTDWGLLYPDRTHRPNPPVTEADAGLLALSLDWDNRKQTPLFRNAWYISARFERGFRELPYNGFVLDIRRYQKLIIGNQAVVIRGKLGSRESSHEQHQFDLGGVGTLRGFSLKEFSGNRTALLSAEYQFRGDVFGRVPLPGFQLLNLSAFVDTGWTDRVSKDASLLGGFGDMSPGNFKTNLGGAVIVSQEWLRLDVARRMDGAGPDDWTFLVRFRYRP